MNKLRAKARKIRHKTERLIRSGGLATCRGADVRDTPVIGRIFTKRPKTKMSDQPKPVCIYCHGAGKIFYGNLGKSSHIGPCTMCSTEKCHCGEKH